MRWVKSVHQSKYTCTNSVVFGDVGRREVAVRRFGVTRRATTQWRSRRVVIVIGGAARWRAHVTSEAQHGLMTHRKHATYGSLGCTWTSTCITASSRYHIFWYMYKLCQCVCRIYFRRLPIVVCLVRVRLYSFAHSCLYLAVCVSLRLCLSVN